MTTATTEMLNPRIITQHHVRPHQQRQRQLEEKKASSPVSSSGEEEEDDAYSRLSKLERKRLSLCQQRVRLERQLFEASHQTVIIDDAASLGGNNSGNLMDHMNASSRNLAADGNSSVIGSSVGGAADTSDNLSTTSSDDAASVGSEGPRNVNNHLVRFDGRRGHAHWTGPLTAPVHDSLEEEDEEEEEGGAPEETKKTTTTTKTSSPSPKNSIQPKKIALQPNGRGTMRYSNGQVYEGNVVNGFRHGFGKNSWPDGQEYTGHWKHNSRAGRGSHMWPDGKTVTGQWVTGHLNGRCFFQWPDGATYDGDTLNGKKHGRGVHTWVDGKIYKGQYEGGFEHGFGTLTEADGLCRYRGNFRYGQRHGYGTQIWKEKTYEGEWQYNAVAGKGKLSWKNGAVYKGEFAQGRYQGHGMFVDKSGRKYVGEWVQGQKEGAQGRETWTDPKTGVVTTFEGSFVKGRRHGFGRLFTSDGSYAYAGSFYKNKQSGRGVALQPNAAGGSAVLHCGMWKNDEPVSSYPTHDEEQQETPEDYAVIWEELRQQAVSNAWTLPANAPFDSEKSRNASTGSQQSGASMDDLDLFWYLSSPQPSMKQQKVQDAEFFHCASETSTTTERARRRSLAWDQ